MKPTNKLALAALLALAGASSASAAVTQTIIRVTGSTAYRGADVTAETTYLNGITGTGGVTAVTFGGSATSLQSANLSIVYGPVTSSNTQTVFENLFNGSIGGDEFLLGPTTENFPDAKSYTGAAVTVSTSGSTVAAAGELTPATPAHIDASVPQISFSDVFLDTAEDVFSQSTTPITITNEAQATVGVVPFVFVAGHGAPAGLNNITPQIFSYIYSQGSAPLEIITGNPSDKTINVVALGRDIDSGTRATALAETGYGVLNTVNQQYAYDTTTNAGNDTLTGAIGVDPNVASTTAIGAFAQVPPETLDGVFMDYGDGGYNSGGTLNQIMQDANNVANTWPVAYLGVSDATAALNHTGGGAGAAVLLSYNSVKFDPTSSAAANLALIQNGQYTFWGLEHEFYLPSVATVATALQTQLIGSTNQVDKIASDGITFSSLNVQRGDDGANVEYK